MMAEPTPRHCQGWLQDCVNSGFVICARGDCICILTLPVMALTGGGGHSFVCSYFSMLLFGCFEAQEISCNVMRIFNIKCSTCWMPLRSLTACWTICVVCVNRFCPPSVKQSTTVHMPYDQTTEQLVFFRLWELMLSPLP